MWRNFKLGYSANQEVLNYNPRLVVADFWDVCVSHRICGVSVLVMFTRPVGTFLFA